MKFENLLELINAVAASALTRLDYEERDVKLSLRKEVCGQAGMVRAADTVPAAGASDEKYPIMEAVEETSVNAAEGNIVTSPLVGTFYAAPAEDEEPFVKVGDRVEKGQTLAIIEAMKLMNEIESDFSGDVVEVYVGNGKAVEYGQPLFRIKQGADR